MWHLSTWMFGSPSSSFECVSIQVSSYIGPRVGNTYALWTKVQTPEQCGLCHVVSEQNILQHAALHLDNNSSIQPVQWNGIGQIPSSILSRVKFCSVAMGRVVSLTCKSMKYVRTWVHAYMYVICTRIVSGPLIKTCVIYECQNLWNCQFSSVRRD